jgi:hypothetical protein
MDVEVLNRDCTNLIIDALTVQSEGLKEHEPRYAVIGLYYFETLYNVKFFLFKTYKRKPIQ